jgi:acyl-CoA thioesterase I
MKICVFGDSIAWGAGDTQHGGWVTLMRNYFEEQDKGVDVYNLGICNDTTAGLLERFEVEAKARKPKLIIIAIGINEERLTTAISSPATLPIEFEQNLSKLLSTAKKFTSKVVFVGLTRVDETRTTPWEDGRLYTIKSSTQYNSAIEKFCKENKLKFISLEGVLGDGELEDGLHPNTEGHARIFNCIRPEVEVLLQGMDII